MSDPKSQLTEKESVSVKEIYERLIDINTTLTPVQNSLDLLANGPHPNDESPVKAGEDSCIFLDKIYALVNTINRKSNDIARHTVKIVGI